MTLESTERMMYTSANHPSVVIYGFLNEADGAHPSSQPVFEKLVSFMRYQWDVATSIGSGGARMVSWASSKRFHDLNLELADVVSFNSYEGWYPTTQPLQVEVIQEIPQVWDFS